MKYRKTALVEAEQFDGSDEMIKKHDIAEIPQADNTDKPWKCFIFTLEGNVELNINDWIATGVNGEHWAIADDVFKKTYEAVSDSELKGQHLQEALDHMVTPKQVACKFCHNFKCLIVADQSGTCSISIEDWHHDLSVEVDTGYDNRQYTFQINYCPMCGRKLGE